MINIVLFGPPGAGKGTQSEKLIDKYQLTHISTGDLFRKHLREGSSLGKMAQSYMDEGNLVPDKVVIDMVEEKIKETGSPEGYIFDGFPRTVAQARALDSMMAGNQMKIDLMLSLEVPDDELRERLLKRGQTSGRADDQNVDKINNRIKVYYDETRPVADFYAAQNKYVAVKGVGTIDEIFVALYHEIDKVSQ